MSFFNYKNREIKLVLEKLHENIKAGKKMMAVLIDPDSVSEEATLIDICKRSDKAGIDLVLVGGSLITNGFFESCVKIIKANTAIPIMLFPGNLMQISKDADAILLLSLISGRNPELLIGKHVLAAPQLKASGLEVIPTGYMLIDGGKITSVSYMSSTTPLPADKPAIAATTALAGEMLGLKLIYMDAGSGAQNPVSAAVIKAVREQVSIPIFIGGGMKTKEDVLAACQAGADIIVVGNAFEKNPTLIEELAEAVHRY